MTQAEHIIARFGGLTPLARALGHKGASTVQGWKERGFIPAKHHSAVLTAGEGLEPPLTKEEFFDASPASALGAALRIARKKKDWTQEQLASFFGVAQPSVQRWEAGASLPEPAKLRAVADFCGLSLDELFARGDEAAAAAPVTRKLRSTEPPRPDIPPLGYVRLQIDQYVTPKQAEAVFEILKGAEA